MALSVDVIPNRSSPPAILLREAWREGKRIRRRTLVNLSKAPPGLVDAVRAWLKGGVVYSAIDDAVSIRRALPHGAVAAVLGMARHLGLERILHRSRSRMRDLALAAIAARIISPSSKLATARQLSGGTATSSLGAMLDLGEVSGNEMLEMLDWLVARQPWIERSLARRHLSGGTLILYDVSSSYMEGKQCPLAEFGHSRDGKRGKRQITYGLLCAEDGCPVAIEVFSGNTADPQTLASQVQKIQARFGIEKVALAGDRGMITTARIREDLAPAGLDWISALRSQDIRKLARGAPPVLVPEALVPDAVAEIASPDFPGERLMVCLNPRLRAERARKREELLVATEEVLAGIAAAHGRGKPGAAGRARTWKAIGRKANRKNVERHFDITVTDGEMVWARSEERIAGEARLDGIWVVRTSLGAGAIGAEAAVDAYKRLSTVERAFRMAKSDLAIRPIHVYTATHVRAHVFLCMLALYVEWHMRRRLAPMLFQDDEKEGAREERA
ncbi:IS1634 family transposase, partial [Candidatus Poriferisocius sp.]|uniref:IS1634 family transposase n=1 Tax=Candidatus Poriferisocius sp. TaxID=3101276 RepID=UPI003B51EA28